MNYLNATNYAQKRSEIEHKQLYIVREGNFGNFGVYTLNELEIEDIHDNQIQAVYDEGERDE